jgi:tripartite-type tricarboxylate transporter receptor subunit TctC
MRRAWRFTIIAMLWCGVAMAQAPQPILKWPVRPIRLVVTFPPGGSTDTVARIVMPKLAERLGQPVIIDNRPGAGGIIGVDLVAKAVPDGYTIVLGAAGALTVNVSLSTNPPYDPIRDLTPITMIGTSPFLLVADPSFPPNSAKELIALAKTKAGQITYASGGIGTAMHLSGELFRMMTETDLVHVPYKGSGPAVAAAAAGQTSLAFADITSALPLMKSGRVKSVGILSKQRSELAPNIPTLAETGIPGYESIGWFALLGPAGMPEAIVSRINAETAAVMRLPEIRERLLNMALEPWVSTPEELTRFMKMEMAKWADVIKASGAKIE